MGSRKAGMLPPMERGQVDEGGGLLADASSRLASDREKIRESVRKRTTQQNRALHKYLRLLAQELSDAGYDMREVIKVPIKPTPENVKETMLRPVMRALYPEVVSTTELTTKQVSELYEVLNLATAERLGISVEFPSES